MRFARDAIHFDAMNAPSFAFMVRHPAHLVALGFGTGLSPVAPGTIGTLVAFPIAWFLNSHAGTAAWLIAIVAVALVGGWCAQITGRDLRVADHGAIVIDEIAAFLFVLFLAGNSTIRQIAAFVLFRVFDIVKPPPIRQIDRATHGALGVMGDDFVAACYTLVVLSIATRIYEALVPS